MARFIWSTILINFGIQPPLSVSNMFGSWLKGFSFELRIQILVGTTACWTIWLKINDVVFNRATSYTLMQVIFKGIGIGPEVGCYSLKRKREMF